MPLSDEEQRTLEQIESALLQDDPDFSAAASIEKFRTRQRRLLAITAVLCVAGAVLLVAGLVTTHEEVWVGALVALCGLSIMATGPVFLLRQWQRL